MYKRMNRCYRSWRPRVRDSALNTLLANVNLHQLPSLPHVLPAPPQVCTGGQALFLGAYNIVVLSVCGPPANMVRFIWNTDHNILVLGWVYGLVPCRFNSRWECHRWGGKFSGGGNLRGGLCPWGKCPILARIVDFLVYLFI